MTLPNKRATRATLLALACILLSGCVSQWRWELGDSLHELPLPDPEDEVTLRQVLDLYGPPQTVSATDTGFVLAWEHWRIFETSVGFSLGAAGADFMSADWGSLRTKGEFILLAFDREHKLIAADHADWDSDGGGGQAVQPFFGFVSVVDTEGLLHYMPQHRWGMGLFKRLPEGLNRGSDPHTGQSGLEQRGTPASAGQRTLEMR